MSSFKLTTGEVWFGRIVGAGLSSFLIWFVWTIYQEGGARVAGYSAGILAGAYQLGCMRTAYRWRNMLASWTEKR